MEIMSRVRLEECGNNIRFMPSEARPKFFLEKYKNKGSKIHCLALKLYTGASKSGGQGGSGPPGPPPPPDPLVGVE